MPPLPSQKGTGKKGRDARQSRSRNSTPNLVGIGTANSVVAQAETGETALLELSRASFPTSDDISEHVGPAIPSSKDLEALSEKLQRLVASIELRGATCDRGMRMLAQMRKDRLEEIETERRDEERKERLKRDAADEEERERGRHKSHKLKKRKDASTAAEERPLTHGAHNLAPQDGTHLGQYTCHINDTCPLLHSCNPASPSTLLISVS